MESVEIRPRVSGFIDRIAFKDGAIIKKGDPLFVIDPRPYEAKLGQSKGELKQALAEKALQESNYARAQDLFSQKVTSKSEFDEATAKRTQADAKVTAAEEAVKSAQLDLEFTHIASPIDGRISRVQVTVGNLVVANQTLLTNIVSTNPVYAYADVDENTVITYKRMINEGKVADGRNTVIPVRIALAGEKDFPHEGAIDFVDNQIVAATGTLSVRGTFADKGDILLPGMFVRMQLPTSPEHEALLVADRAVGSDQGQKFLLVVKGDTVEMKPVKLGAVVDGLRVVLAGLDANDQVIVSGVMKARPGSQVKVEQGEMMKFAPDQADAQPTIGDIGKKEATEQPDAKPEPGK